MTKPGRWSPADLVIDPQASRAETKLLSLCPLEAVGTREVEGDPEVLEEQKSS